MNPLSWERNEPTYSDISFKQSTSNNKNNRRHRSSNSTKSHSKKSLQHRTTVQPKIDLLTFGYQCKLFSDDEQARYLDQGKNLIPFDGDNNLLIDRFDVRSYLNTIDLQKYDAKIDINYKDLLTEEEIELEEKLDKERYRDLYEKEVETNHDTVYDEELIKLKDSIEEDDKKYNQIRFDYNAIEQSANDFDKTDHHLITQQNNSYDDQSDEQFILPDGLKPPQNIRLPNFQITLPHAISGKRGEVSIRGIKECVWTSSQTWFHSCDRKFTSQNARITI